MAVVANPADPVGLYSYSLLVLIRTFEAVKVINNAGRVTANSERFVVFNRPVGLDIDDYIFFQRCCSN